jgi:hypothetical protein
MYYITQEPVSTTDTAACTVTACAYSQQLRQHYCNGFSRITTLFSMANYNFIVYELVKE